MTPVAPLYHYTGKEALKGILENHICGASVMTGKTDIDEFRYSLDVARKELKRIAIEGDGFAEATLLLRA